MLLGYVNWCISKVYSIRLLPELLSSLPGQRGRGAYNPSIKFSLVT